MEQKVRRGGARPRPARAARKEARRHECAGF